MNQTNKLLTGILVLQVVLIATTWTQDSEEIPNLEPLLPAEKNEITDLTISYDASTDTERRTRTLHLARENGGWVIPEADGFPVESDKVDTMIDRLLECKIGQPIAKNKGNHNALNVGDKVYGKALEIKAGDKTFNLIVGKARGASMHIRFKDQKEVYLVKGMNAESINGHVATYVDAQYVRIDDPTSVKVINEYGPIDLNMGPDGRWRVDQLPPDAAVDQSRARAFVASVSSVRIEKPVGKKTKPWWRLDTSPRITVSVSNPMKTIDYKVGAAEKDLIYVKSSKNEYVVQARKYTLETLITQTPDMFIDNTPTQGAP